MKYHIVTFGCAANASDSERLEGAYISGGFQKAANASDADEIVINTCMIRQSAENRVYGLIRNLSGEKAKGRKLKIIVTGCMVGMAMHDKTGKLLALWRKKMPAVDEFLSMEEVGFSVPFVRSDSAHALVPISNGCNNYCSYCVVPYARGREVSRPYVDIIRECKDLAALGYTSITLVGQNVNSYGSDIVLKSKGNTLSGTQTETDRQKVKSELKSQQFPHITYVKHLGRLRIPTLFPQLLKEVSAIPGIRKIDFISSNPWDFSDELIRVIAGNAKISRHIHLPVQSGSKTVLKRMNRWYTPDEYIKLVKKLRDHIPGVTVSTDIIVGFCGEKEEQFEDTVALCRKVGYSKAYISIYSDRPGTQAHKTLQDDIPYKEKKRRWEFLDEMINKSALRAGTYI